ncbi:MAG: IclR family transcriptional regulator [Mesorhizobium sp.]|uniref:IclR family transcriptional regulator n=1 Tax=Mesorhizobium sp. TaxID=1871066 RepID=UPI00121E6D52|nr:helix-turn-helix domain-containing protein [Mesorhizobium sp.]TIO84067.1 MAG: IclR family transcriptional regulator [Mesorhizobium sp.]
MAQISANAARAADILLLLSEAGTVGISLKLISERMGEPRSTLHRSLAALAARGFVEPGPHYGSYRLGPAAYGLALRKTTLDEKLEVVRPALYAIVADTGYATFLMAEAGLDALCLELVSNAPIRSLTGGPGGRVPLGIAAGSLAILAELPAESRRAVIRANSGRYAVYPALRPMSGEVVARMVEDTQLNGYSCDFGCFFPNEGGIGVAVPAAGPRRSGLSVAVSVYGEISGIDALERLARRVGAIFAELGIRA